LAQALSVKSLLSIYNIPSITYLGARFEYNNADTNTNTKQSMKAHAWLSVGPDIVIGHSNEKYTTVGVFTPSLPKNKY